MASTRATAERRAAVLQRLEAGAAAIAQRQGAPMPPPAPSKDKEIAEIIRLEYAAGAIEAALAMLTAPDEAADKPAAATRRQAKAAPE